MADTGIYSRLTNLQHELKVPKAQNNLFGKYNYRSCEDILEALKPLLLKHELTLVIGDKLENIGDRYYVHAEAILYFGSEYIKTDGYAREEETKKGMDGSQITGAASSYARKYALNGLFAIDDTKDADSMDNRKQSSGKTTPVATSSDGPATPKQRDFVSKLLEQNGVSKEDQKSFLISEFGLTVPLTFEGAQFAINELKQTVTQTPSA